MDFKNHCVLVLWMKVASALEGLRWRGTPVISFLVYISMFVCVCVHTCAAFAYMCGVRLKHLTRTCSCCYRITLEKHFTLSPWETLFCDKAYDQLITQDLCWLTPASYQTADNWQFVLRRFGVKSSLWNYWLKRSVSYLWQFINRAKYQARMIAFV